MFNNVGGARPSRSFFNLTYDKKFTCDMGELIPVMHDEVVPGDVFNLRNSMLVRMQPLVAPAMHEITVYTHYFFCPYRILAKFYMDDSAATFPNESFPAFDWEQFISGGPEGDYAGLQPLYMPTDPGSTESVSSAGLAKYTLWDYFGLPVLSSISVGASTTASQWYTDSSGTRRSIYPNAWPQLAYNLIYREYYRDQNLIPEHGYFNNNTPLIRAWRKDYFTSALPFQQRGAPPSMPLSGNTSATFPLAADGLTSPLRVLGDIYPGTGSVPVGLTFDGSGNSPVQGGSTAAGLAGSLNLDPIALRDYLNTNNIDMSNIGTFTISDLRTAVQLQKWLERNARTGVRYTEFLKAHFGVSPRDDRLQRPEYIGGTRTPIMISEVLQTSSTDDASPQGNMAGHGITSDSNFIGRYRAYEYGIIIGMLSIMPRATYQQGMPRQWSRRTRYDYYFPEFSHLSEQAVLEREIYWDGVSPGDTTFGFQGIYDEMRYKPSLVCSEFRDTLNYWHLGRIFDSAPTLNRSFIECVPDKRIFAVPSEKGFLVWYSNIIKAVRPMPNVAEPGFMDHF